MKKILFIIGTKPEAIKLKPVIEQCKNNFKIKVCLTNQHPNLDKIINEKCINLKLIRNEKGLSGLTGNILNLLENKKQINKWKPDLIIVHGDTTSSLCGALYAFYNKIKLCHVESGLRSNNKQSPFPEEINRKIIDALSDINFCPTIDNKKNLYKENVSSNCYIVGNTIIDSLKNNILNNKDCKILSWTNKSPYVVVTLHRRENWEKISKSIKIISKFAKNNKLKIVYVCNKNKKLKNIAKKILKNNKFVYVSDSIDHSYFQNLIINCSMIITDSGGIQEEAVYYKKPIIILRDNTERQEIIKNKCGILANNENLLKTLSSNIAFSQKPHLFGNGKSSIKIAKILSNII